MKEQALKYNESNPAVQMYLKYPQCTKLQPMKTIINSCCYFKTFVDEDEKQPEKHVLSYCKSIITNKYYKFVNNKTRTRKRKKP